MAAEWQALPSSSGPAQLLQGQHRRTSWSLASLSALQSADMTGTLLQEGSAEHLQIQRGSEEEARADFIARGLG